MNRRRSFALERASVSASRQFVDQTVVDLPLAVRESAILMVSELATNAVVHATTGFEVSVTRSEISLRVEVRDAGGGEPTLRSPSSREPHGRGLQIVKELSDAWGMAEAPDSAGKTVWFELLFDPVSGTAGHHPRTQSHPNTEAGGSRPGRRWRARRSPRQADGSEGGQSTLSVTRIGRWRPLRIGETGGRVSRPLTFSVLQP